MRASIFMATADRIVFVVDPDETSRASLTSLLKSDGLEARGHTAGATLLEDLGPDARGCLIVDLSRAGGDSLDLISALKTASPLLPIIAITAPADVAVAVEAMKAGASDVLEKPVDARRLLRIARAALEEHEAAFEAAIAQSRVARRIESLTARERQVLDLIMQGASNKVVAQTLAISPRTVEIYRANVMSKMRAGSLSDLIRMTLSAA